MIRFLKKYTVPICLFIMFLMTGILFTSIWKHVFYIINFTYIGFFVALTVGLMIAGKKHARILSEFAVGIYMLVFLGILNQENMQLEGFFYYAAMGIFRLRLSIMLWQKSAAHSFSVGLGVVMPVGQR